MNSREYMYQRLSICKTKNEIQRKKGFANFKAVFHNILLDLNSRTRQNPKQHSY